LSACWMIVGNNHSIWKSLLSATSAFGLPNSLGLKIYAYFVSSESALLLCWVAVVCCDWAIHLILSLSYKEWARIKGGGGGWFRIDDWVWMPVILVMGNSIWVILEVAFLDVLSRGLKHKMLPICLGGRWNKESVRRSTGGGPA
jgi:hypothetical protein